LRTLLAVQPVEQHSQCDMLQHVATLQQQAQRNGCAGVAVLGTTELGAVSALGVVEVVISAMRLHRHDKRVQVNPTPAAVSHAARYPAAHGVLCALNRLGRRREGRAAPLLSTPTRRSIQARPWPTDALTGPT
jgi:hypothetical protein